DAIAQTHRALFLSPHFDDAVYSAGGAIALAARAGLQPVVITVFGGMPPAAHPLSRFAQEALQRHPYSPCPGQASAVHAVALRRPEDAAVMRRLEVDYVWLDHLDGIFRGTPAYYPGHEALLGGEVHRADMLILRALADGLGSLHARLPDA